MKSGCKALLGLICFALCFQGGRAWAEIDYLTILAFGDSITQGYARDAYGYEYGNLAPLRGDRTIEWGYEIELEILIEDTMGPGTSSVYNWGYHGLTTAGALDCYHDWECIDDVLASREADLILILLGANDLNAGIPSTTTRFNLSMMIDKSRSHGVEPVLGTITPNTADNNIYPPQWINLYYNPMIRDLAREKGVPLAEHYEAMEQDWDSLYCSGDGIHLSATGNRKLAQTWHDIINRRFINPVTIPPILHLLLKGS